jgi:DNA ligase-1
MTFTILAGYFRKLEDTPSRIEMTKILAELFRESGEEEIGKICHLIQGRVVPMYEALEFGMADKFVIRAIAIACNTGQVNVISEFKKTGDLGITAENIMRQALTVNSRQKQTITQIFKDLYDMAVLSGQGSQDKKITKLAEILSSVDPLSARYIVRIPLDKLRLGFSEMTILDGLSWMLTGNKSLREKLEEVYNLRPDIGYLAGEVKKHGIKGLTHIRATLGVPILPALCQRLPTADEMIKKMGTVAVEPKYDGMRVQIHYQVKNSLRKDSGQVLRLNSGQAKLKVHSYSRNLEDTTGMFPELNGIGKQLAADEAILDSEVVGLDIKTGRILPFQETTTRKRKHQVDLFSKEIPLRFYVFDILYKDGRDLLSQPLSVRRKILEETLIKGEILEISPQIVTSDAEELRKYHDGQLKKGLEGAVVKKWESRYEPGRRGFSWVKFKEEEGKTGKLTDTIDTVVMGYYRGEGKRSGFGIGAFLVGVKKNDTFVTVTKVGTGVSDELWKDLHRQLEKLKTDKQPKEYAEVSRALIPDVWINPELVVEIAGDDLTKSPNHGAGIAVRFPRLVKIRNDKSPEEATSTVEIRRMFDNQAANKIR